MPLEETKFFYAIVTLLIGSILSGMLSRRAAKKMPKTTERAKAYEAYVTAMLANKKPTDDIIAKIMVYGESNVVKAISRGAHLPEIIIQMRKSVKTGFWVKDELSNIIHSHNSPEPRDKQTIV